MESNNNYAIMVTIDCLLPQLSNRRRRLWLCVVADVVSSVTPSSGKRRIVGESQGTKQQQQQQGGQKQLGGRWSGLASCRPTARHLMSTTVHLRMRAKMVTLLR